MKILKDKKGVNDVSIAFTILGILLLSSIVVSHINNAFNTGYSEFDSDELTSDIRDEETGEPSDVSAWTIIKTFLKIAFWDFGDTLDLPFWLDAFYTLLTITMIFIAVRNLWVGGGG